MERIKRLLNENRFIKDASWNTFGVLSYFGCQLLITFVVVWLSDDMYNAGNLNLAMTVSNIFCTIALYNIRFFQVSDIKNEYNDSEYVAARVLTCAAAVLLCTGFVFIADFSGLQRAIIICYLFFRINESLIDVLHGIDQKNHRMDYIGKSLFSRGVLMLAVFVVLIWLFDLLTAVIGITVITVMAGLVYDLQKTKKLADFVPYSRGQIFSLLKRCFPLMIVLFIITMIPTYVRYSLERIHGTEALGIYASVAAPTLIVQVAAFPLFAPLANLFAVCIKEGDKKRFIKLFTVSTAVILGIIFVFTAASFFVGQWGLGLLYGESMPQYAYLLPGAFIISGLIAYIWFMNVVFTATRDIKGVFSGNLIGVIICVAATGFFLTGFGLEGANHVMIISQSITVLCLIFRLFWYINKKLFIPGRS